MHAKCCAGRAGGSVRDRRPLHGCLQRGAKPSAAAGVAGMGGGPYRLGAGQPCTCGTAPLPLTLYMAAMQS